jgi:cellulose synthase/poly-beta-1,6-N-acetylglucosamine synthase-like glycosyltransferase
MGRFRVDTVNFSSPEEGGASMTMILLVLLTLLCFLLRFTRLFVGICANIFYKPIPVPASPTYIVSRDVTVLIPTVFKNPSELAECIGRMIGRDGSGPKEIFVIVLESNVQPARELMDANSFKNVTVLGVPKLGKRNQLLRALPIVQTEIVAFADDDVFYPDNYLQNLIAIFENPKVGAGGTCQRTRRTAGSSWYPTNFWNILGISYLERRVFNNLTTNAIDGSISTLSGRTSAWRTKVLKCQGFYDHFVGSKATFRGKKLDSDDDKSLTLWGYSQGWEIVIQRSVCLETTLEENPKYIHQCLRWARARFRGNFTVMSRASYWRSRKYAWGTYVIYFSMFQNPSLFIDIGFAYLLSKILAPCSPETQSLCWILFLLWVLFTKLVRLIPHMMRHPSDLVWMPALILFGYFHSLLNIYALCTLTTTAWGGKDIPALNKTDPVKDETVPLLAPHTLPDGQVSDSPSS